MNLKSRHRSDLDSHAKRVETSALDDTSLTFGKDVELTNNTDPNFFFTVTVREPLIATMR